MIPKSTKFKLFRKRDSIYILLLLAILFSSAHVFERSQIWMPDPNIRKFPSDDGIYYENVDFLSMDGALLNGWYCPTGETACASVLFCHGNGGNISTQFSHIPLLNSLKMNVFIFDYRGYGKSAGFLTERGTYLDAQAAYHWLKNRTPDIPIIIHGWSLGAAIATDLAAKVEAAALINECGFTSIPAIAKDRFPFLPTSLLTFNRYNAASKISKVDMPVLIVYSPDDDTVLSHHGETLFRAASEPKEIVSIAGGHDCATVSSDEYKKAIQTFMDRFLIENNNPEISNGRLERRQDQ